MKKIGEVVSQFNRFLICRSNQNAMSFLGKSVYSQQKSLVGTVVDIFGPVEKPYLKILKKNGNRATTLYVK